MTELFMESLMDESLLPAVSSAEAAGDPERVYLRHVRHYPLLTREQEIDLAYRMERANARILRILSRLRLTERLLIETGAAVASGQHLRETERSLRSVSERPKTATDQALRQSLLEQCKDEDQLRRALARIAAVEQDRTIAREKMAESNLRLVASIARKYVRSDNVGDRLHDLIQEGSVGLLRAIDKFDYRRGTRFATHASWWIRQAINRFLDDQTRAVRLPCHVIAAMHRISRAQKQLEQQLRRETRIEDIASELRMTAEEVQRYQRVRQEVSLHATVGQDEEATLAQFLWDTRCLPAGHRPEDAVTCQKLNEITFERLERTSDELLETLSQRDRTILKLRFGLIDGQEHSLEEIGALYSVSRERVRQWETEALRKLRHPRRSSRLQRFVNANFE
jgi:RNA polymerase primary sigma factor